MIRPRSMRWRLLIAVNAAMGLPLLLFLIADYRREMAERVADRHVALEGEAKTLFPAVLRIRMEGLAALQHYVDDVCGRMQDASSPGHHIVVGLGGEVLQATAHGRSSKELWEAIERAASSATHRAAFGGEELIVGSEQHGDVRVYVSEYLADLRRSLHDQVLKRLGRVVFVALAVAAVVNLVFLQMATRPLERLVQTVRRIAAGEVGAQAGPFRAAEAAYLAEAINAMSASLAEAERHRRAEIAQARQIQEHLLPDDVRIPGVALARCYQPAAEVAGDYYDLVALSDGSWLFAVADVTGHGIPAAMGAVMIKTLLLSAADRHSEPGRVLQLVNRRWASLLPSDLPASLLLVRWDPAKALLDYSSAGHEPGWFLPVGGPPRALQATGPLLGVMEDAAWETERFPVRAGDRLLLVTDGLTEAVNPRCEVFGRDRLAGMVSDMPEAGPEEMVSRLVRALTAHRGNGEPTDDVTIVAAQWTADGGD